MGDMGVEKQQPPDWANLEVLHRNTLEPRTSFSIYKTEADALTRDVTKAEATCLSGKWKFHLASSPFDASVPVGFEESTYDDSSWKEVDVPGMWQLQGFGRGPQYTNVQFPFHVDPPHPPYTDNECGFYTTTFIVENKWDNDQLRLRFEGVDSGFHVWVNGHEVGYHQGARNPSEFDITKYVKLGQTNRLAVQVYQFTDGSYIEDQDQWRMSGIFRDVYLLRFPEKTRFEDFSIETKFDEKFIDAVLNVTATVHGAGELKLKLLDPAGQEVLTDMKKKDSQGKSTLHFSHPILKPLHWTAETPNLYTLIFSLDSNQFVAHRVGFRQVHMDGGLIKVNGKRVVFKGANRHEHHPVFGRAVPYEFMKNDLLLMKRHNLNAIRTCHQPSDYRLYDLCDELGLWVMDEADLECHGFETIADAALPPRERELPFAERQKLTRDQAAKWTSDNPAWKEAYVDRAKHVVCRDRLHPSVVLWSLGNEAFYGRNHTAMRDWIKEHGPSRLIHYEPDVNAEYMDMYSRMYPHLDEIIKFGQDKDKTKPLVLCEYIHAMGTGPGNIKEYIDAFYEYEKLQGGWVWEWANHGLLTKTKDGRDYYGYGGDFGDVPNDYNFVMDGVLNSDHTPSSGLLEYKKALEPVQLLSAKYPVVTIINRLDFQSLDFLECVCSLSDERGTSKDLGQVSIPNGVQPGTTTELKLPQLDLLTSTETLLNLHFRLREGTSWADAGHELALLQVPLTESSSQSIPRPPQLENAELETSSTPAELSIKSSRGEWIVDLVRGQLTSWLKDGTQMISQPVLPSFYRAPTDNDAPQDGRDWKEKLLHLAKVNTRSNRWTQNDDGTVSVSFDQTFGPPALSWHLALTTTYHFSPDGKVKFSIDVVPEGQNLPNTLPRVGITLGLPQDFSTVKWFGRGPGESYIDMKLSQPVGLHSVESVQDLWPNPDFPQECGNRTDTRWVELSSNEKKTSLTAYFVGEGDRRELFDFMACHYHVQDIDEAQHPFELEERRVRDVVLRLDKCHHGLGTGSCGPKTLERYALKMERVGFEVLLF